MTISVLFFLRLCRLLKLVKIVVVHRKGIQNAEIVCAQSNDRVHFHKVPSLAGISSSGVRARLEAGHWLLDLLGVSTYVHLEHSLGLHSIVPVKNCVLEFIVQHELYGYTQQAVRRRNMMRLWRLVNTAALLYCMWSGRR